MVVRSAHLNRNSEEKMTDSVQKLKIWNAVGLFPDPELDSVRHQDNSRIDSLVGDMQNKISSLIQENERLMAILRRNQISSLDPLEASLK